MIRAQAILMSRLEKSSSCNRSGSPIRVEQESLSAHGAGIGVRNLIHIDTLPFLHLRMDVLSVLQKTLHDRILNRFVFGKREQGLLFQAGFHLFTGHCACAMANACPRFKRVVGLEMPSTRRDSMSAYPWERESSLSFLEHIRIYMTEVGVVIGI